jgi:hypothetical protein
MVKRLMFALLVLGGCSTKANPNACCVSADDCSQAGLDTVTACDQGLTCVNNQCLQETCATDGCTAAMPVCSAVTNACEGCSDSSQCASYDGATVCDTSSGACVGCAVNSDCPSDKPICDMNACRACEIDADCASGACGDNGQCLAESDLIYVDNGTGTDVGQCSRAAPCASIPFALGVASPTRSHIVLAAGLYDLGTVQVGSAQTSATAINIHGGGAMLRDRPGNDGDLFFVSDVPMTIHDVTLLGNGTAAAAIESSSATVTVYRAKFEAAGSRAILAGADLVAHDIEIANASIGIMLANSVSATSTLTLDRAVIHGGSIGIRASATNTRVMVSNTLVFDTQSYAMDLSGAGGRVSFSTIADAGSVNGSQPVAIACSSGLGLTIASSVIWTPQAPTAVSIGAGCGLNSVIAGPFTVSGAMNVDPRFVDETHRDYHLATGSPARDVLDSGPATDFEGDPRPQGPKYDLGADEAR